MFKAQPLVSEKYMREKMKRELKEVHRARNRKAFQDFFTFVLGLAAMPLAIWVGTQIPNWMPVIQYHLDSIGF